MSGQYTYSKMKQTNNQSGLLMFDEFVVNPSKITQHLIKIVSKLNNCYEEQFATRNIIKKITIDFKMKWYLKDGYYDFYLFLKNYTVPDFSAHGVKKLEFLFKEFERLDNKLIFNNFALAYAYTLNRDISSEIFTKEDKKILFLKKLGHSEITLGQFNEEFGHYALNPYELSSKRFEEYSYQELLAISNLVSNFNIKKKVELQEYMESKLKKRIPTLIALRELAKYHILFIVRDLRYELLNLAEKNGVQNIFDKSFDEIVELSKA